MSDVTESKGVGRSKERRSMFSGFFTLSFFKKPWWFVVILTIVFIIGAVDDIEECPLKGDSNCDGVVDDFELLDYIDLWVLGNVSDYELLDAIDIWANPTTTTSTTMTTTITTTSISLTTTTIAANTIAFSSNRDGDYEIYLMNPDGTNLIKLTNNTASDRAPAWSPNRSKIAFSSNRDGDFEIYTMDSDGSNQVQLTNNSEDDNNPAWSPDGERIAFDLGFNIYAINHDGSNQTMLMKAEMTGTAKWCPAWSPDGERIAYTGRTTAISERAHIYVINLTDMTIGVIITSYEEKEEAPTWSPDGERIVITHSWEWYDPEEIAVISATGGNLTTITTGGYNKDPSWSPDGTQIAFSSDRSGNYGIWIVPAAGGNATQLTNDTTSDIEPAWL